VEAPSIAIRRWLNRPARAADVAVLRVVVFGLLASTIWLKRPWRYAGISDALLVPPDLLGPVVVGLPRSHDALLIGSVLAIAAAAIAAWGRAVGIAGGAAVLLSVWVLGVTESFGKVDHFHHLLWLAAVLAAGRTAYGATLRVCWLLIGACYFFPGVAKAALGADWFSGRRLEAIQQTAIVERSIHPPFELHGALATVAASGAVVFELGFVFLVLTSYRRWALATAIVFHGATWLLLDIDFRPMILILLAMAYGAERGAEPTTADAPPSPARRLAVPRLTSLTALAVPLLTAVVLAGAGQIVNGWPVAQYPPFDYEPGTEVHTIVAIVDGPEGCRTVDLLDDLEVVAASNRPALIRAVLNDPTDARLDAIAELVPGGPVIGVVHRTLALDGTTLDDTGLRGAVRCPS
jgi:hypothetical protein